MDFQPPAGLESSAQAMLPLRPGDKLPQDPTFKDPPQWIHEVAAAVLSSRESKRRAVLKLLDRLPLWPGTKKAAATRPSARRAPAARRSPS
jgi:hypothetical protein